MKYIYLLAFTFCFCHFSCFAQKGDSTYIFKKNGITKPSILSTHPFGIFFSRLQGNFKTHASESTILNVSLESGNIWALPVKVYIPNNDNVRALVKNVVWHKTEFLFDVDTLDAKTIDLKFDGVLKGLRANVSFRIAKEHELNVGLRMYILTKGRIPFSSITSDDFIEFFHKNIAGGDDPFGRKLFGLNKATITYKDRNDNTLDLNNNDFFIGGVETSYYYYPESLINKDENFFVNFGAHLGINLSKYNASNDFGISTNVIKAYNISDKNYFHIAISIGSIRKNIIEFKKDNIDFGNNQFIGYLESALEYNVVSTGGTTHSFGTNFYLQSRLNK